MRNTYVLLTTLCAMLFAGGSWAKSTSNLDRSLTQMWAGKLRMLRQPCSGDRIVLDAPSGPAAPCNAYNWANDSVVDIKHVKLTHNGLRVDANRMSISFDPKQGKFGVIETKRQVRIEVKMSQQITDAAEVSKALDELLQPELIDLARFAPAHWQLCLRAGLRKEQKSDQWVCRLPAEIDLKLRDKNHDQNSPTLQWPVFKPIPNPDGTVSYSVEQMTVYTVGQGITPPKERHTPDPDYPDFARRTKLSGSTVLEVVIDEKGRTQHIQVVRPIGSGFDERAVGAVRDWKFDPATLNGKPVPVLIAVEVKFEMY